MIMNDVPDKERLSILIADDEQELLASLQRTLKTRYKVTTTDKSVEVMEILRRAPVDCVLLDIRMPGMTGIELLKEIKFAYAHVPVLIMTGHGGEDDTIAALKLGASGYIKKPIDLYALFDEIERVNLKNKSSELKKSIEILFLDDEEEILDCVKTALTCFSYNVTTTTSVKTAFDLMQTTNFDIVIVDLRMPEMDGLQFIEKAREIQSSFISIVITGLSSQKMAIDAIKHGVFDYIRKPIDINELTSAVERSVNKLTINRAIYQKNCELAAKEKLLENLNDEIVVQKNYLENIVRSINNILIITDPDGVIKTLNNAAMKSLGYAAEELIGKKLDFIYCIDNLDNFMMEVDSSQGISNIESECKTKNSKRIYVLFSGMAIKNKLGKPDGFVFVAQDISSRKAAEKKLYQLSYYDSLTGLPNRLHFEMYVRQSLTKSIERHHTAAFLYLDLDSFKSVNDRLGHPVGDELLKIVSKRLEGAFRTGAFRSGDFVARMGGDEFVVYLGDFREKNDAGIIAERVIAIINKPFFIAGNELSIGTSIGIAFFSDDCMDYHQVLKNADIALYKAKHEGRNKYQYFTPQLDAECSQQIAMENALRFALARKEFSMVYQPIVDLKTKKVISVEALIRWDAIGLGVISPEDFIPMAEYSGLILPIAEWAMDNVLQQFSQWRKDGQSQITVALNISATQIDAGEALINILQKLCEQYQIEPACIGLELTETAMMHNPQHAQQVVQQLHELGFSIILDDFGQGFSSLSLISQLPISILKIDKQFVEDSANVKNETIIRSIIALAKGLSVAVVAEGVETAEQAEHLMALGCEYGQGFFFCEPLEVTQVIPYLSKASTT